MRADMLFFLGVLLFFFIAWFATGGPTKPISFSGPYITPITNVDVTQAGYGPDFLGGVRTQTSQDIRSSISSLEDSLTDLQRQARDAATFGVSSPYQGKVVINNVRGGGGDVDEEYVDIRMAYGTQDPVDITGWRLQSAATGRSATIGRGTELLSSGEVNDTGRILLQPSDEAFIVTGESPVGVSFRENECIGYLDDHQDFTPSLSDSCPDPRTEFELHYTGNELGDDRCYELVQSLSRCSVPDDSKKLTNACFAFIDHYLNYNGCVATHRYDSTFSSDIWHIYLDYDREKDHVKQPLWKDSREGVRLLDENGKTVDLYTY